MGTDDSFWGQECDIRRMNVGMTGAGRKLLLVDDSSRLCSQRLKAQLLTVGCSIEFFIANQEVLRFHSLSLELCVSQCCEQLCRQAMD